ncbi:carnitine O-acetyltransferase-like isoform X3 [Apostichopus japonicus]
MRHTVAITYKSVGTQTLVDRGTQTAPILGGRMFSQQKSLSKFPVPPLQQTLYKYLLQLQPLVGPEEYEQTKQIVDDFGKPEGMGEKLQMGLLQKFKRKDNWFADWWSDTAYLGYREPVVVNVSPGIIFPRQDFNSLEGQIEFAAKLIAGLLDYNYQIATQTLAVDMLGGQPLCMDQYHKILAACRIPGVKKDKFVVFPPYQVNSPRHIVVAHNNHFFALEVLDEDKKPFSLSTIYHQLKNIMDQSQVAAVPLGLLTTEHRNTWGKVYKTMKKDATNYHSFDKINRSLFMVCLDKSTHAEGHSFYDNIAREALYGGGSRSNSGNRWFDKTLQFLIRPDGGVGMCYEHSSAEGPPIITLVDHTLDFIANVLDSIDKPADETADIERLEFNINSKTVDIIDEAKSRLESLGDELQISIAPFTEFGKNYVKKQMMSPDAFIQMAFQLTYYKLHGEPTATYESGSLRKFQYGRTETIRSLSVDSQVFVKAMLNAASQPSEKVHLLRKAVAAHKAYTKDAMAGDGIDRHLLGLKLMAIEIGENVPEIFMDPSFSKSTHFRMSTSQVPAKHDLTMCFGPVAPDGYGLCYNPHPDHINFAITAYNTSPETDSDKFSRALRESLLEMKEALETAPPQSRL